MARIPKKKAQAKVNPNQNWEAIGLDVLDTLKTMLALLKQFELVPDSAEDRWAKFERNSGMRQAQAEFEANKRMRLQTATELLAAQIAHEGIGRITSGDIWTAIKLADETRSTLVATADPVPDDGDVADAAVAAALSNSGGASLPFDGAVAPDAGGSESGQ